MLDLKKAGFLTAALALTGSAAASISFNVAAGQLRDASGTALTSGLIILVIDTDDNGFEIPSETDFAPGAGDLEVYRWNFSEGGNVPGEFLAFASIAEYNAAWSEDDSLALFWYPTLDKTAAAPGDGANFGVFADPQMAASGDMWFMPADGTHGHSLQFFAEGSALVGNQSAVFASQYVASADLEEGLTLEDLADVMPVPEKTSPTENTIAWTVSSGAQAYSVQRRVVGGDWRIIALVGSSVDSYVDDGLTPGLTYEYRVVAENGLSALASASAEQLFSERSIFTGIAARGFVDNSAPYTLLNGGIILKGNDSTKKIIASGLGPHNAIKFSQVGQWLEDPFITLNLLGSPVIATSDDWIADFDNPGSPDPDLQAMKDTMANKTNVSSLDESPAVAKDGVILEDLSVSTGSTNVNNIFKVRSVGADAGFAAIEVYDAEYDVAQGGPGISDNRIFSISSRSWYPGNTSVSNASVTIEGDVPKEVLAIAQGPSINAADGGSAAVLEDPILRLQSGGLITQNDDWDQQTAAVDIAKGLIKVETDLDRIRSALFDNNLDPADFSKDSVLLVTLAPGSYIFRVVAKDGTKQDGSVLIALSEFEME